MPPRPSSRTTRYGPMRAGGSVVGGSSAASVGSRSPGGRASSGRPRGVRAEQTLDLRRSSGSSAHSRWRSAACSAAWDARTPPGRAPSPVPSRGVQAPGPAAPPARRAARPGPCSSPARHWRSRCRERRRSPRRSGRRSSAAPPRGSASGQGLQPRQGVVEREQAVVRCHARLGVRRARGAAASAPRLAAPRRRASSTSTRRIICAARLRKWSRLSTRARFWSTSRR